MGNHLPADTRVAAGDTQVAAGDTQVDSRAAVGDTRVAVGDTRAVVGDTRAVVGGSQGRVPDSQLQVAGNQPAVGNPLQGGTRADLAVGTPGVGSRAAGDTPVLPVGDSRDQQLAADNHQQAGSQAVPAGDTLSVRTGPGQGLESHPRMAVVLLGDERGPSI